MKTLQDKLAEHLREYREGSPLSYDTLAAIAYAPDAAVRGEAVAETGSRLFAWLVRASQCGIKPIEQAAEVLKDYYQGVGPEPEYDQFRAADAPSEPSEDQRRILWNFAMGKAADAIERRANDDTRIKNIAFFVRRMGHLEMPAAADALDSQSTDPYPLLRAAFTTAESSTYGYFVKFKFPTMEAMQAAHMQWYGVDSRASSAPVAPLAPDGWKLVPYLPTHEMIAEIAIDPNFSYRALVTRYSAMLAAAPAPQQEGSEAGNG